MALLNWMKKDNAEDKTSLEVQLPDETQKKLDTAIAAAAELPKLKEMLEGFKSIQGYVEQQQQEKEAAAARARAEANQRNAADTDAELQNLILTDPGAAIKKGTQDQSMAILMLRADQLKRDVFEDADKFPYYAGEVKSEIDKLLGGQSIQARNDSSVIENCYYTVVGRHAEEAREGKLKSRFASSTGTRGTASGSAGAGASQDGHDKLEINDDIRKAARITGMTPEAYAEMLYKEGVGYV